jgi:hypothetical protein
MTVPNVSKTLYYKLIVGFMNKTKQIIGVAGLIAGLVFGAHIALADDNMPHQSLHITEAGKVSLTGAKVISIEGSNINATISWGGAAGFSGVIKTNGSTEIIRREGGRGSFAEIVPGHYINVEGTLDTSASKPTVIAKVVRDWSVMKSELNPFGIVSGIDTVAKTFMLKTQERGDMKVFVSDQTTFTKGKSTTTFSGLKSGDMVTANGVWDKTANTLQANRVKIRIEDRRVFEGGRLKTAYTGSSVPASIVVTFGRFDYTVNISSDTAVLNSKWAKAMLSDFKVGDHIRVYGAADGTTIDATVVRDVSLR